MCEQVLKNISNLDQKTDILAKDLKEKTIILSDLTHAFIASQRKLPVSTASERGYHQEKFKADAIKYYQAQSNSSSDYIKCTILGLYIQKNLVRAGHLCGLNEQTSLITIGKQENFKWSPMNCVLMLDVIEKAFDSLEVTLLYHPGESPFITFQVLYDLVLDRRIISDYSIFEGYSQMSAKEKKNFRKRLPKTFGELNGKKLKFPPNCLPSSRILFWASHAAYSSALTNLSRTNDCARASSPSEEGWEKIEKAIYPPGDQMSRLQKFLAETELASDTGEYERENVFEYEKEEMKDLKIIF